MSRGIGRVILSVAAVALAACDAFTDTNDGGQSGLLPAPAVVAGLPGPGLNEITVTWASVSGATNYTVYWGSTPNVTPQTGTRLPYTNATILTQTGLTANTTYYFVVTAVDGAYRDGTASAVGHATASGDIGLQVACPAAGGLARGDLTVGVSVVSRFLMGHINASVGGRSVDLAYGSSGDACTQLTQRWVGKISIDGLPRGPLTLSVVATDTFAHVATGSVSILHGDPPALTIVSPDDFYVARPSVRVAASCVNEDLQGCAAMNVWVGDCCANTVAAAPGSVDQSVSLAAYDGQSLVLTFQGSDSPERVTQEKRRVFVESSPLLTEVASVNGAIFDVQPDRILFLNQSAGNNALSIHDRLSGSDVVIYDQAGHVPQRGYLTPLGAMFIERDSDQNPNLHEWRSGVLSDLGVTADVVVKGRYAVFPTAFRGLIERDVVADVNTLVGVSGGRLDNFDGASNGDVVYASMSGVDNTYQVYRFRNGVSTQLTNDAPQSNRLPKTDGVNVVYRKALNAATFPIAMYDSAGEHILSTTGTTYQAIDAWVIYDKAGQIWTRSPTGEERQVTRFSTASTFEAVGPNGEIVLRHDRRYLAVPDYSMPPRDLSSGLGLAFFQNGSLYIAIGRSLFRVSP